MTAAKQIRSKVFGESIAWVKVKTHEDNVDDSGYKSFRYDSVDGEFYIEVGGFCGERGGDRTAYIAHDRRTRAYLWTTSRKEAVAWCEEREHFYIVAPDENGDARDLRHIDLSRPGQRFEVWNRDKQEIVCTCERYHYAHTILCYLKS